MFDAASSSLKINQRIIIMKKSLTALAVFGAFAGTAMAADVTMYGVIDTGLAYTHDKSELNVDDGADRYAAEAKSDEFRMDSGNHSASRFGIRGTEDLGNGMTVGFKLENGFDSDSGALGDEDRLFNREATLSIGGTYGTVYMGRMGSLVSDAGSVGFYGAMASAFASGWSDNITGHTAVMADYQSRYDNTIAYVSPEFAGVKVFAQYAMGDTNENKNTNDRYAALGAEWKAGALDVGFLVDWLDKDDSKIFKNDPNLQDTYTFNLAGSYDCGFAKTFMAVQYFKDARDAGSVLDSMGIYDLDTYSSLYPNEPARAEKALKFSRAAISNTGYGVHIGTTFEALGGNWLAGIGYMEADIDYANDGQVADSKAYTASLGYEYSLSKRTMLYTGAGYVKREADINGTNVDASWEQESYDFVAGLVHKF